MRRCFVSQLYSELIAVEVGVVAGVIGFAWFDAGGGRHPDDGDEGTQAESHVGMGEGHRNSHQISEERVEMLALDGGVLGLEFAGEAEAAANGEAQQQKAEAGDDHRRDVEGDREGVHLFFKHIRGEEGQQRQAEEEEEIGIEDELIGLLGAVDQVVMIYPIYPRKCKGDGIDGEDWENRVEPGDSVLAGNFELKHHDGDDDGDDSVGEGFKACWRGQVMARHGFVSLL